ncbi:MAG: outer membrane protein [Brevundimonas sp.]|uniref:outer membrane protein n=1 Tax=Brevundimonas sp. TaxID=1871086 RepID=UPI00391DF147
MKSLLLVTAAVSAFAAAPALAQDGRVGSVGVTYSNSEAEFGGVSAESDDWALDGVVAMPAFGAWTVTLAGAASQYDDGSSDDTTLAGTAHLTTLISSDLRVGGFVGAADVADETALTAGFEAQKYLARATLTGVVAYTTADDADLDVWSVGGDAAFYVTDALRLNAGVSWMTIDDADVDGFTYGAGAEYEIASTPFSVTAGYSHSDIEDLDVDTWTVGLRYSFGGGLQARDRAGAALPGAGVMGLLGSL